MDTSFQDLHQQPPPLFDDTQTDDFKSTARDFAAEINKEADKAIEDIFDPLKTIPTPSATSVVEGNLLEMGDSMPEHKLDTFISEFKSDSEFQKQDQLPPFIFEGETKPIIFDDVKATTNALLDFEREAKPKEEEKHTKTATEQVVDKLKKSARDVGIIDDKKNELVKKQEKQAETSNKGKLEAEALFCHLGLDAWFRPSELNPKVESLIYWRDPKKSGPVFGGVLLILLALTYFSLISVVAYLSLLGLTCTVLFRVYKNVLQAVQKTGDGHPFKELLESDVGVPQDKARDVSELVVAHVNGALHELRRLFLVEDLVDSIKFGVFLWCMTYVGAWFNGMTVVIIAWVALFTLPKVYEMNKTQIDNNLQLVKSKLTEVTSKVKAAIPIGKKEEKKDQ